MPFGTVKLNDGHEVSFQCSLSLRYALTVMQMPTIAFGTGSTMKFQVRNSWRTERHEKLC